MIPQIKTILYATDLAPNAAYVFRYAAATAHKHDARMIILHVFEKLSPTAESLVESYLEANERIAIIEQRKAKLIDRIRKRLEIMCEKECESDPRLLERIVKVDVVEGYPADMILKKADEHGCDIIVVGAHGKGWIENTFLGSVSRQVLRRTRKPTYVIPIPKEVDESDFLTI